MRLTCLLFLSVSAVAQNPTPPAFDVASVKINTQFNPNDRSTALASDEIHPGSLTLRNFTLTMLVAWAYDTQRPQVAAPDWVEFVRYDISAKAAGPAKEPELRQMLQALLAQRFQVKIHRESRQMSAYVLLAGKNGPKMTVSKIEGEAKNHQDPERGTVIEGATIAEVAENFSHDLAAPVVDSTGLTGRFDFTFNPAKYLDDMRSRARGMAQPVNEEELKIVLIQNILDGELGLRLEPRRMAVPVIVIDRAEKTPSEN